MIAGQISHLSNNEIDPPHAEGSQAPQAAEITLDIHRDGSISLKGQTMTLDTLRQTLSINANTRLSLRADKHLTARELDEILKVLREQGAVTIRLYTQKKGGN